MKPISKIIILYDSRSGTTEKMAEAVAEGAKQCQGVEVELLRVGRRFNLSEIDKADAIIFGSPNYYNNVTPEFERILGSLKEFKDQYNLAGKIGGVFESYGWLGGFVEKKVRVYMDALDMRFVEPAVSVFGKMPEDQAEPVYLYDEDLKRCRELGRTIAVQIPARAPEKSREQQIQGLRRQVTALQQQLEQVAKRLETLERL